MRVARVFPDKLFLKIKYYYIFKEWIDFSNPRNYNEKIQWLKLYDRKPEYSMLVDKAAVKEYVSTIIGEDHIIPTIGLWDRVEDINFDALPERFVLKCTHDSNSICFCRDKRDFDKEKAKTKLKKALKNNFYKEGREWPYKNVKPRIIAEKLMTDESGEELKDYKVFCFDGEPRMIQVDSGRFSKHVRNHYTTDWEYIDASINFPTDRNVKIERPKELDTLLRFARNLSKGFIHLRVDFYIINEKIYFGEITFYHGSGYNTFNPKSFNNEKGNWIKLPLSHYQKGILP